MRFRSALALIGVAVLISLGIAPSAYAAPTHDAGSTRHLCPDERVPGRGGRSRAASRAKMSSWRDSPPAPQEARLSHIM